MLNLVFIPNEVCDLYAQYYSYDIFLELFIKSQELPPVSSSPSLSENTLTTNYTGL